MNEWMNNPALKNMDPLKLELIKRAALQSAGRSGKELAPVMMSLISGANQKGIRFRPDEINMVLDIMKEGKTEKERAEIDKTINFARSIMNQKKSDH